MVVGSAGERATWAYGGVAAATCLVLSLGLLLLFPVLERGEPDLQALGVASWESWRWWGYGTTLAVQAIALVRAWRAPRATFVAVVALVVPAGLLGPGPEFDLVTPAVMVSMYALAVCQPMRRAALVAGSAAVVLVVTDVLAGLGRPVPVPALDGLLLAVPQAVLTVAGPTLLAAFVRSRREVGQALAARLEAVEGERAAVVRATVAQERTSMARELHDVAAHHLSGIAVMAAAVETLIDSNPEEAKASVRQIRAQSRSLVGNMRELVGLLRHDSPPETGPASLGGITDLVQQVRWRGVQVSLDVLTSTDESGADLATVQGLGPLAQVSAYRMVQEALANATIHAPGAACAVVVDDRQPSAVTLVVTNGPAEVGPLPSLRSGLGLVGMQERAELTGATLEHGATPDGGWRVSLTLPRDSRVETTEPKEAPE